MHVRNAEPHGGVAHLRVLGNEDQVAAGGELTPSGQAVPVHLGDHRLGQIPDTHPAVRDVPRPGTLAGRSEVRQVEALVPVRQVVACTETLAVPPQDGDPHLRVSIVIL